MKIAAAEALAALAKEPVPAEVCSAYNVDSLEYGFDYIIPKPLDPRILTCITPAVAKAAMDTGLPASVLKISTDTPVNWNGA